MSVGPSGNGRSVIHVSSAHRVSDGRISKKEAASLAGCGYRVTILALQRAKGFKPSADVDYIEYDQPSSRVHRFFVRLPWLIWFCAAKRFDVYHLHDPELVLLGLCLKILGRRVVYDVHEAYPMVILDRDWIPRLLRPTLSILWRHCEAFLAGRANLTVVAHDTLVEQFKSGRIVVVKNYPITRDFDLGDPTTLSDRPARVIHHGDLTPQRGVFSMVEAMGRLSQSSNASLHLVGSMTTPVAETVQRMQGASRCCYLGWLDGPALARELDSARAGLVLLHPTNNYMRIYPNKLYEYMAAGLPVIASDFPHWREVVETHRCGILVDPLDASAIARAIDYIMAHPDVAAEMGGRGRKAVLKQFNWQPEGEKLADAYQGMWA